MHIDIITIFPEMFVGPFSHSIIRRAVDKGLVTINICNIRDFSTDKHRKVDDYPFGGGPGMVMMVEPIFNCINYLKETREYDEIIYLSPDGDRLNQPLCNTLSTKMNLILLCGHYKGIDERVRENLITMEISIGDYVLSGGELPAAILTDSLIRLLPGVLGDETSALSDSFQDGLLSPPVYTRPQEFLGWRVPDILLTGNDQKIAEWRHDQAVDRTRNRRPDLYKQGN